MKDGHGRVIDYLRISLTDRCNFRCVYCMPEEGVQQLSHFDILRIEEVEQAVRVATTIGIKSVRLTGGEPTVRKGLVDLVRNIAAMPEIENVSMTTNGVLLPRMAADLKAAGLSRVNLSLDTLDAEKFHKITRCGSLDDALRGIDAALESGFNPVKINAVALRSLADGFLDFAKLSIDRPLHVRFIEHMPIGDVSEVDGISWGKDGVISCEEVFNIINEGALRAVREGRKRATQDDFEESVEVVIAGQQRKSTVLSDHEKQVVSYHEIGHAIVAARQKGSAPVTKITIVPRTSGALGYTMQVEEDERFLTTRQEVLDKLAVYCGGRAAEELIFGEMTTGAANDIEQATKLARNMVTRFGMSDEFGMMALGTVQNAYLNQDTSLTCAPGTAERVDAIVAKLIEDAHDRALQILKENKFKLHELARYLYKKETITGEEFMNLLTRENPLMPKQQ